jgi:hypothetical protein
MRRLNMSNNDLDNDPDDDPIVIVGAARTPAPSAMPASGTRTWKR